MGCIRRVGEDELDRIHNAGSVSEALSAFSDLLYGRNRGPAAVADEDEDDDDDDDGDGPPPPRPDASPSADRAPPRERVRTRCPCPYDADGVRCVHTVFLGIDTYHHHVCKMCDRRCAPVTRHCEHYTCDACLCDCDWAAWSRREKPSDSIP